MKPELSFDTIIETISAHASTFYKLGIDHVGVHTQQMFFDSDIEIFTIFDYQKPMANYYRFQRLVEELFPGYVVEFIAEKDIEPILLDNFMTDVHFCQR